MTKPIPIIAIIMATLATLLIAPAPAVAAPAMQGLSACAIAVNAALGKQNYPYVWGAKGPASFDCSGLTYWAYQQAGMDIGLSTYDQQATGTPISCTLADLHGSSSTCWQAGDLIFLSYPGGQHVALYAGDGLFMDAYNRDVGVVLHDVSADSYYWDHFWQARRPIECAGTIINPGTPTTIPPGSSPGIESIANILPSITLLLPWSCGACAGGQSQIAALTYPDFGADPLYPFKWFGVWLWNEIFRSLICWLLAIAQGMLNALAYAFNAVIVAGINLFWRLLVLFMLWFRDSFIALFSLLTWFRDWVWDLVWRVRRVVELLSLFGQILVEAVALMNQIFRDLAVLIIAIAQGIGYLFGLIAAIIPGMITAIVSPTAPPQLADTQTFFLFVWFVDIFRALADSKLAWAWFAFVGVVYLKFVLWAMEEISTLNQ